MEILYGVSVVVLGIAIWILNLTLKSKKKDMYIQDLEESNKVLDDKLPFLTTGNILLCGELSKILQVVDLEKKKKRLSDNWNITDRESALNSIQWLLNEGNRGTYQHNYEELLETIEVGRKHELKDNYYNIVYKLKDRLNITDTDIKDCKNLSAFDFELLGFMLRVCFNAEYLSEQECYQYLEKLHNLVASTYKSWKEYAIAFYIGYVICMDTTEAAFFIYNAKDFLSKEDSLWNLYPLGQNL